MSLRTLIDDFITQAGTDFKTLRDTTIGALSGLTTTDKSSIVSAINEVKASATGSPPSATETTEGVVERATLAEVATGTDGTRYVSSAGVRQERDALKAELLGGANAAWDTLQKLKALVDAGDTEDQADITALTTVVGTKQAGDAALTSISGLANATGQMLYTTDTDTFANAPITAAGRAILDDADVAAQRTTLDVYSKAEIGSVTGSLVTQWQTAIA